MNEISKLAGLLGVLLQRELDEEQQREYDHLFHGNKWHLLHQCDCRHNICYFQCLDLDDQGDDPVMVPLLEHVLEEDVEPLEAELVMEYDDRDMPQLALELGMDDDRDMLRLALEWEMDDRDMLQLVLELEMDDRDMLQLALRWVHEDDSHMLELAEVNDDGVQCGVQWAMNVTLELATHYTVHGCMRDFDDNSQDNHYLVWILPLLIVPAHSLFETFPRIGQKTVVQL